MFVQLLCVILCNKEHSVQQKSTKGFLLVSSSSSSHIESKASGEATLARTNEAHHRGNLVESSSAL